MAEDRVSIPASNRSGRKTALRSKGGLRSKDNPGSKDNLRSRGNHPSSAVAVGAGRAAIRSLGSTRVRRARRLAGSRKAFSSRAGSSKVGSSLGRRVRVGRPDRVASARTRCHCSSAVVWSASC
ncbi:hypothetical protein GCM10009744_06480 [Kribbella alba]|uniref:Uncharacterized protein n=1 Tax=Kribbella alba TaxID=190197 RepID=A0ABN2F127_9ACTN